MTKLDLPVACWATAWDSAVQNADILQVPGEVSANSDPGGGAIPLDGDPRHVVLLADTVDRRGDTYTSTIAGQELESRLTSYPRSSRKRRINASNWGGMR